MQHGVALKKCSTINQCAAALAAVARDSVFSFLFSDPDTLRELYCALEGVTLPQDVPVTINTLHDVLYTKSS